MAMRGVPSSFSRIEPLVSRMISTPTPGATAGGSPTAETTESDAGLRSVNTRGSQQGVGGRAPEARGHALEGALRLGVRGGVAVDTTVAVRPGAHQVAGVLGLAVCTDVDGVHDRMDLLEQRPHLRRLVERARLRVADGEDGADPVATVEEQRAGLETTLDVAGVVTTLVVVHGGLKQDRLVGPVVKKGLLVERHDHGRLATGFHVRGEDPHALEHEVKVRTHAAAGIEGEDDIERRLLDAQVIAHQRLHLGLVAHPALWQGRGPGLDLGTVTCEESRLDRHRRHTVEVEGEGVVAGRDLEVVPVVILEDLGTVGAYLVEGQWGRRLDSVSGVRIERGHRDRRGYQQLEGTSVRGIAPLTEDRAVHIVGGPLVHFDPARELERRTRPRRAGRSAAAHSEPRRAPPGSTGPPCRRVHAADPNR